MTHASRSSRGLCGEAQTRSCFHRHPLCVEMEEVLADACFTPDAWCVSSQNTPVDAVFCMVNTGHVELHVCAARDASSRWVRQTELRAENVNVDVDSRCNPLA